MLFSTCSFFISRVGECPRVSSRSGCLGDPTGSPVVIRSLAASIAVSLCGKRFPDSLKSICRWAGDLDGAADLCGAAGLGVVFGFFLGASGACLQETIWVSGSECGRGRQRRFQRGRQGGLQPASAAGFQGLLRQKVECEETVQSCPTGGRNLRY